MPRTAGVSSSSTVWLMRRSPSPRTVARWLSRVPTTPRTNVTLTVLPDFFAVSVFLTMICGPLAQYFLNCLAALGGDFGRCAHALQAVDRCADYVVRIRRAQAFRKYIGYAHDFKDRTHGASRNDSGAFRCRLHEHFGGSVLADDCMLQRTVLEADLYHFAARLIHRLLHGHRHFPCLAFAHADSAISVAHHGQGGEPQNTAAFHHFGDAIHGHHLFSHAVAAIVVLLLHSGHDGYP